MKTLHRKIFLPRFFPDGKIAATKGLIKPSNTFLFTVFYISVSVFPICFISFAYFSSLQFKLEQSDIRFVIFFFIILALDIVILIIFKQYYSSPLKKLKEGTEKVKKGDYTNHVQIVSNDSFGQLADTFNDMITSIDLNNKKLIAVPDAILQKPGKFTDEEYEKMKMHSAEGARIVGEVLKEVDDKAFEIISESGGSHFDPELTKEFIKCRTELEELYNRLS